MTKNPNQPDAPLSDDAADILHTARIIITSKEGRRETASHYVTDAMHEAIENLPDADRQEVVRRLQKLFAQQFKTPEVGEEIIRQTRQTAKNIGERVLEVYKPRIEESMRKYMEENYERLVEQAGRALLADVLAHVAHQFAAAMARPPKE